MRLKNLAIIYCLILVSVFVSAETCSIETSCSPDNTIMKLADSINSHGELWSQTNYDYFLCCDFQRSHECTGANKIISLSAATNAHAEVPDADTSLYANDVCYGNFECRSTIEECSSDAGEMGLISLSDYNNAHIGAFGDVNYLVKICCAGVCTSGYTYVDGECTREQLIYWSDDLGNFISQTNAKLGYTTVLLNLKNSGLSEGTSVVFQIYEENAIISDSFIRAISGIIDINGSASVSWTITQTDLDVAFESLNEGDNLEDFYFKVNDVTSGGLNITVIDCAEVNFCRDYSNQVACELDGCLVGEKSVQENTDDEKVVCGTGYDCYCAWDNGVCAPAWSAFAEFCGNGIINTGETCDGTEWGTITECADFDYFTEDEGTLSCDPDYCFFDTSLCTGGNGIGPCGDEVINIGETCDGNPSEGGDWGPITGCQDFDDFAGGTLYCNSNCHFDTSLCTGGVNTGGVSVIGSCIFNENTDDTCDDGFLTYSWLASFNWNFLNNFATNPDEDDYIFDDGGWHYDPERVSDKCADGSNTIPCPAQIQLPFFTLQSFLASLIILAAIYFAWNLKNKKLKIKKIKQIKKKK
ncbi:MAG: hypothetical protein KKG94_00170 [Nanoarchaeota archaeon]|nr:hypothetical protein [Nanoarchaeota archaeon]